jgi:hypothetical protein
VRYDANTFPEDLVLLETRDRSNFQGRYVQHHPWTGKATCEAANAYRQSLPVRFAQQAKNLEELTGWSHTDVAGRMAMSGQELK